MVDTASTPRDRRPPTRQYSGLGLVTMVTGSLLILFILFCGMGFMTYIAGRSSPSNYLICLVMTLVMAVIHFGLSILDRLNAMRFDCIIQHHEIVSLLRPDHLTQKIDSPV